MAGGLSNTSRGIAATVVGAVIGGVTGYVLFTEREQSGPGQVERALEDSSRELVSFRNAVRAPAGVANNAWELLNATVGGGGQPPAGYPSGQTSPL